MAVITLTTDFGAADHYVAAMKGVILSIAPEVRLVDVTHEIRPQDVVGGAFVFRQAFPHFPAGTIHVIVVDPGVGTARPLIAARYAGQIVLTPDNGSISFVHADYPLEALREISNQEWLKPRPSATFHGRDILAPAAAQLALGRPFEQIGPTTDHLEILDLAGAAVDLEHGIRGCVIHVDRFGNLVTNITRGELDRWREGGPARGMDPSAASIVYVGETFVGPLRRTYGEVGEGELLALIGSSDLLEIAVNGGSAANRLNAAPGSAVRVR
ncbi:MAG: SAM-dependent chlorinase/fluorinase [Phycisphaerae bacterium]